MRIPTCLEFSIEFLIQFSPSRPSPPRPTLSRPPPHPIAARRGGAREVARNVVQRTEEDQGENEDDPPKVLAQTVRTAAGCALHYKRTKYQLQKNRCVFWPTFFFFPLFFHFSISAARRNCKVSRALPFIKESRCWRFCCLTRTILLRARFVRHQPSNAGFGYKFRL